MQEELARAEVLTETGAPVALRGVCGPGKTVLVFLRHFGCIACRAHAVELQADAEKLAPARLVFIGNGPAWAINGFKSDLKVTAPVYTDPGLKVFQLLGFKRSLWATFNPSAAWRALLMFVRGHRQGKIQGDVLQQGGVVIVDGAGEVAYSYASAGTGDFPPLSALVAKTR